MASKRKKKNNRKRHYIKRERERQNRTRQYGKNYLKQCAVLIGALKKAAEESAKQFQRAAETNEKGGNDNG